MATLEAIVVASQLSRRAFLATGVVTGMSLFAGCLGEAEESPPGPGDPSANSEIRDVRFDGGDMVVELRDGHAVTRVNLIDPDGETYTSVDVPRGETTSRLQLLDIRPGLGGYEHYEPGSYELIAVHGEEATSMDVDLVPDLHIVDIDQYRDGDRNEDLGKLAVTVVNRGTGPTWVYDITTKNAPNQSANDPLVDDPGVPRIDQPETPSELIIQPGSQMTVVGIAVPFLFVDQDLQECSGEYEFTVRLGVATGDLLDRDLSSTVNGEVHSAGLTGQYTCSRITIESASDVQTMRASSR